MTTKTKAASEVIAEIQKAATANTAEVRHVATMKPDEWVRQGDLEIRMLEKLPKHGAKRVDGNRQLVEGSTKGSRHVLETDAVLYERAAGASALAGPYIDSPKKRVLISHPEHGHMDLPPGKYETTYQRDYKAERAEEIRRAAD